VRIPAEVVFIPLTITCRQLLDRPSLRTPLANSHNNRLLACLTRLVVPLTQVELQRRAPAGLVCTHSHQFRARTQLLDAGAFGGATNTNNAGGVFGAKPAGGAFGAFGGSATGTGTGAFGGGGGAFGTAPSTSGTTNAFSQPSTSQSGGAFGSSVFGAKPAGSTAFGATTGTLNHSNLMEYT
jgi:hypothetical protein